MAVQEELIVNIIVIGEANVGKTNLVLKFVKGEFVESSLPTIGLDYQYKVCQVDGAQVTVKFWDTAG